MTSKNKDLLQLLDTVIRHVSGLRKLEARLKLERDALVDEIAAEAGIAEKNSGQKGE